MKLYILMGTTTHKTDGGTITRQFPAFYLSPDVQGIMSCEHARKMAQEIVNPTGREDIEVSVSACLVDMQDDTSN